VDRIYPFEEAKAAYLHLASGTHFGKIVVSLA
jgi:NADPH:quinone reductase-like Zn-dependent oxidoreductase